MGPIKQRKRIKPKIRPNRLSSVLSKIAVESKFGARLDSLADFVFVLAVGYKLFQYLKLPVLAKRD